MKQKNRKFKLQKGSVLYFLLLAYSFILTQLLRNAVSGALFLFVLLLPVISLVHCLIGRSSIQIFVSSEKLRAEKNEPLEYEIRILNPTILSFPFIEAVISEPGENAVRCSKKKLILSLVPFGSYAVKNTVKFKYRGFYEIGVDNIYISDLFRFFALRADMGNYAGVSVFPRKMPIVGGKPKSDTDVPSSALRRDVTAEWNELSQIRDYIPGDSVRDIHWKLSSKTQDIKVKQYSSAENRHVYVLCDMAEAFVPPKKKDSLDIYDSLKKYVESENEKERKRRLQRSLSSRDDAKSEIVEEVEALGEEEEKVSRRAERRKEAKYKRNIKSGMSEAEAEMIRSVDELINSSPKRTHIAKKKEKGTPEVVINVPSETTSDKTKRDLDRILEMTAPEVREVEVSDASFGGRVKASESEDYNEFCLDAVVEFTVAEAISELRAGNACTVAWYDSRAERGLYALTVSGSEQFEDIYTKLAACGSSPSGKQVANLAAIIPETTNVTVKIVTSNIDPESTSSIGALPARFGGSGTGCSVEVILFSPVEKYEDPSLRAVYTAGVMAEFARRGINCTTLAEVAGDEGTPVFTSVV